MTAHFRFKAKQETLYRDVVMAMARAGAKMAEEYKAYTQEESQGHWGMMKAMIQMQPRKCMVDETVFFS